MKVTLEGLMNLFGKDGGISEISVSYKDEYNDWAIAMYELKNGEWIYMDSNSYPNFTMNDIVKKCSVDKDVLFIVV